MRSLFFTVDKIRLHAMTAGPVDGPPVILLHGFPDFWYGWRYQIPALAEAGFRVIAVDQRGYNVSDKPKSAFAYRLKLLTDDIAGIIEQVGGKAAVVGHDWGGGVTWSLAMTRPELVSRFAVLNCPHPLVFGKRLFTDPRQTASSWYMGFFQIPWLPEAMLRRKNFGILRAGLREAGEAFTREDSDRYVKAWSEPGALTGSLNWYRALKLAAPPSPKKGVTPPPGLMLWGTGDNYLREVLADESAKAYPALQVEKLEGVSHWVQTQAAEKVNSALLSFLKAKKA